jgi:hypothetical protein
MDKKFINQIINDVIVNKHTMVSHDLFHTVTRNYDMINSLPGDIIECGVWKGGYSVFLSHLFKDKTIWVCDSFKGFQEFKDATYKKLTYPHGQNGELKERFTKEGNQGMAVPLSIVKNVFKTYNLDDDPRIKFIEGYVNKTLPTLDIREIALLRVDVDSYSATKEVLDNLYDKVVKGGMIIFDDICLTEASVAIKDWMIEKKLPLEVHNPYNDEIYSLNERVYDTYVQHPDYHTGSYIIKK